MTDKEQTAYMIDKYMDLLRVMNAADKEKELRNQLRETKAKLVALGVAVDDLIIE